jgi:quercetin dioxygenase-like cupin family protein
MTLKHALLVSISVALIAASPLAAAGGSAVVMKNSELTWKDMGNGVAAAVVSGDMQKGASRFFLKYPVGLVTPNHHHSADHYATVVSGSITLTVDGKDRKLGPGDYFALTKKAAHVARVEGSQEAVFFIQADAPWDVVVEK